MRRDERDEHRWNNKDMRNEKSRDSKRTHLVAASHETFQARADERNVRRHIRPNSRGEVSLLVPRQQITSERHGQHEREQHATRNPKQLAPALISTVEISLREVQQ